MPADRRFADVFCKVGFKKESKRLSLVAIPCSKNISQTLLRKTSNWLVTMGDSDACL